YCFIRMLRVIAYQVDLPVLSELVMSRFDTSHPIDADSNETRLGENNRGSTYADRSRSFILITGAVKLIIRDSEQDMRICPCLCDRSRTKRACAQVPLPELRVCRDRCVERG